MQKSSKILTILSVVFFCLNADAQEIKKLENYEPGIEYENIHVHKLTSVPQATSFVIWVKKEVKPHKHLKHTEHVYILEGSGTLKLGKEQKEIKAGDFILIPPNTVHSVKIRSEKPMKVISVQTPEFKGEDRIFVDQENNGNDN